ncbi:PREDICTED: DNA helicase B [Gavialis gangeticus]|uniref:DNA helicase B n=1 Tax=Gavialis gangeticus TaxID=94835 RepID=UPI00092F7AF6|nr:PREDICTED: DNA helicase B [Gavialis gangeticus]
MARAGEQCGARPGPELWGRLLPPKDEPGLGPDGDEEEEEEEEEGYEDAALDEPFLAGPAELSCEGAGQARRAVIIQEETSQKKYAVVGRFPFVGPWWKVNIKVKQVGSKNVAQGYPSYFLQADIGENQKEVFSLFLKECKVPDDFILAFFNWLPANASLDFRNLEEILDEFQKSKLKEGKNPRETKEFDIFVYVMKSFTGKMVLIALMFPMILEFLPRLLPRYFCKLLERVDLCRKTEMNGEERENASYGMERLIALNKTLKNEPWKLGFSTITSRELDLSHCEATWGAFCQCDHLLWKIPELQKNALIIYNALKQRCRDMGHTCEDQDELTNLVSKDMPIEHAWQSLKFLKDEMIVVSEKKLVFLAPLYRAEIDIAGSVKYLLDTTWQLHSDVREVLNVSNINKSKARDDDGKVSNDQLCEAEKLKASHIPDSHENSDNNSISGEQTPDIEPINEAELDLDQVNAVKMICSNPVTIISGKGGCGKTTVVSSLFQYLQKMEKEIEDACKSFENDQDVSDEWNTFSQCSDKNNVHERKLLNVLLTAPTGRAASLLNEKTHLPAYTLHQIIHSFYAWNSKDTCYPWKFSSVTVLVVDEGSLVSVQLLSAVLKLLCAHAQLAKLIILGDVRQLPSIDPGNVLADMFEALKLRGGSVELRTNHRAESQLIVDNATRISQRKFPVFDARITITGWNENVTMPSPEKKFIFVVLPSEGDSDCLQYAIKTLLEKGPGLQDPKQSQFIAFRRRDCDLINELCCRHYSDHVTRNHKKKLVFQCNDKICCTRNTYLTNLHPRNTKTCTRNSDSENPKQCDCMACSITKVSRNEQRPRFNLGDGDKDGKRLCNGDVFFITDDVEINGCRLLTISSTYGSEFTLLYKALRRACHIKHAWARTIHTFQGSEEKTIVYVVGNAGRQHWQHVYTAVTRGRCRVYIVAKETQLRKAVTNRNFPRKTRLKQRLKEAFAEASSCPEQTDFLLQSQCRSQEYDTLPGVVSVTQDVLGISVPAEVDVTKQEKCTVLDEMETSNGQRISAALGSIGRETETPVKLNGYKRERSSTWNSESPLKMTLMTTEDSPLGTAKLKNLNLGNFTPKALFKN